MIKNEIMVRIMMHNDMSMSSMMINEIMGSIMINEIMGSIMMN